MSYAHFSTECGEHHALVRNFSGATPRIVVLCGSTRFRQEYYFANQLFTLAGEVVLSCGVWGRVKTSAMSTRLMTEAEKSRVDELHKRKIDLADHVFVVDPGGYIGDSTRSEIDYATAAGKPISYWSCGGLDDVSGRLAQLTQNDGASS